MIDALDFYALLAAEFARLAGRRWPVVGAVMLRCRALRAAYGRSVWGAW